MSAAAPKLATAADLLALGDDVRAEIIHGSIIEKATPSGEHSRAQFSLAGFLSHRYARGPGGHWPGGWWFGTEIHVEYATHEVFCHDVAGWRRDRVPTPPQGFPVRVRPDWVCEILSPRNEKRDLVDKLRSLHGAAVPHYWILNPVDQILVVHRFAPDGYVIALTAGADETVRAEPFDAVDLPVAVLFGADDEA